MSARILVVDDVPANVKLLEARLSAEYFDVLTASNGAEALDILTREQGAFDLLLTDIQMPVMDGITLVKNLRTMPDYKFTPLLMLTTESTPEKKMEGKSAGATGWLIKPFNPDQLVTTIKRVLG